MQAFLFIILVVKKHPIKETWLPKNIWIIYIICECYKIKSLNNVLMIFLRNEKKKYFKTDCDAILISCA